MNRRWVGWVTIPLYVLIGVFPYFVSGLVIPPGALTGLMICWGIGLMWTLKLVRTKPVWSLLSIPVALVFWFAYLSVGEALFGWNA